MENKNSDCLLWEKAKTGNRKAFEELYIKYTPELYSYGRIFSDDSELVKDCIQDVFSNILRKIDTLKIPENIKYYLLLSVKNQLFMEFRRLRFNSGIDVANLEFEAEHIEYGMQTNNELDERKVYKLKKLINSLPSRQKEILYYRYFQELSIKEISTLMDVKYQSAQNLIQRSLEKLRKSFDILFLIILNVLF